MSDRTLFLWTEGDETIAIGALAPIAEGVAHIERLWTAAPHRRRGYARRILAELERRASQLGYRAAWVRADSDAAAALFRSAGYRELPPVCGFSDAGHAVPFEKRLPSYYGSSAGSSGSAPASSVRPARSSLR
jgi:polar amino acid transport system permease protein